jgi:hypothetical protein
VLETETSRAATLAMTDEHGGKGSAAAWDADDTGDLTVRCAVGEVVVSDGQSRQGLGMRSKREADASDDGKQNDLKLRHVDEACRNSTTQ